MTTYRRIDDIVSDVVSGLIDNDGATVSPFEGESSPVKGYMVGVGHEKTLSRIDPVAIRYWVATVLPNLSVGHYVGAWVDRATGIIYLDVSLLEVSLATATRIARDRGELAIYDLTNGETIYVQD